MRAVLTMSIFLIGNFLFSQKAEIETIYLNANIKCSGKEYKIKVENSVIYNYQNIKGDILLNLNGTLYLFKKVKRNEKGVTKKGYSYVYSTYISNSNTPVIIQKFNDNTQGVRFIISDDYIIHLF